MLQVSLLFILDKPIKGHTLMQTIARANRVYDDEKSGLIVDYGNVYQKLEEAYSIYGEGGRWQCRREWNWWRSWSYKNTS